MLLNRVLTAVCFLGSLPGATATGQRRVVYESPSLDAQNEDMMPYGGGLEGAGSGFDVESEIYPSDPSEGTGFGGEQFGMDGGDPYGAGEFGGEQFGMDGGDPYGAGEFGGEEEDNDMLLALLELVAEDFAECGLPMDAFGDEGPADPSVVMDLLKLSRTCSLEEEEAMRNAFDNFEECSGYDELLLDEDLVGSLLGAMVKCVNSMSALDMATMNLPEDCAMAVLGNHPLGKMLRDVILHPGETGHCFSAMADSIPECSIDLWPFPVDGKPFKMAACLNSKLEQILSDQCLEGLRELGECLPASSDISSAECGVYPQECSAGESFFSIFVMSLPKTLQGMPLPDSCVQQASTNGLTEAVDRYEAYRNTCAAQGKSFWERMENPQDDPRDAALRTFAEFLNRDEGGQETGNQDNVPQELEQQQKALEKQQEELEKREEELEKKQAALEKQKQEQAEPCRTPTVGSESSEEKLDMSNLVEAPQKSSGASFGSGVLTGFILVAIGYGVAFFFMKKRRSKVPSPGFVELSTTSDSSFA